MSWLLDTNVCIAFLNGTDPTIRDRLAESAPTEVFLCSVVKAELLYGAQKSRHREANRERLRQFFALFQSLPFDDGAAERYGETRAQLAKKGSPIGPNDLLIAAIALAADAVLVTRNRSEFDRVEGLRVETW